MGCIRAEAPPLPVWARLGLLVALFTGFGLRLQALTLQDIWWDEARNIDVALRPFLQVAVAPELDIHPPVYFWLLHGWARLLDLQMGMAPDLLAFGTRLLSVMAGVIGIALLARLAQAIDGASAGLVAGLLAAWSPFWLAESQESRMYTVAYAWLLLAALAFWLADPSPARASAKRAVFVVASAAALLTHYNAVFVLAAWYGWWLIAALRSATRPAALRTWLLSGVATALLVLPVAPIALRQIPGYANPNLVVPSLVDYLRQNWQAYWGGYALDTGWAGARAGLWLWVAAALGLGGALLATWQARARRGHILFLWVWLAGSLALYYLAVLDRGAFNVRYASFVTPALYALVGMGLSVWGRLWRPLAVATVAVALALWPQAIRADLFDARFARENISGVTAWLRDQAGPDDLILVDQKYPFGFYYGRYATDPLVTPAGDEAAPARYLFVDINTIDQRLNEWARDAQRVYWVQWYESDTDPRRAVPFLLDQAGQRAGEQNFQGYSVDWWELSPPNAYALAEGLEPLVVRFPSAVQTVEVSAPREPMQAGAPLPVVIRWQRVPGGSVSRPLKARVALYSEQGERLVQADERLLNDRHLLPSEWLESDRPLNVYLLETEPEWPEGAYWLGLLVYDADTLEPLGAVDAAGAEAGVEANLAAITLAPPEP